MADTKRERREHARELAKANREAAKKRQRRNRWFLQGGIGAGVLAVAAVVLIVATSTGPTLTTGTPSNTTAGGVTFHGEGGAAVPVTSKTAAPTTGNPAKVDLYIDWSCPVCQQFETSYAKDLTALVASGDATLTVHPVAILDHSYLGSRFSSRAANAAACVADAAPSQFLDVQTQMYANQPEEGTRGLTTARILELVHAGGVTGDRLDSCVRDESFSGWVSKQTAKALNDKALVNPATGGFGTPTALINGKRWNGDRDFIRAVEDSD